VLEPGDAVVVVSEVEAMLELVDGEVYQMQ
jgi:hypothetical protein